MNPAICEAAVSSSELMQLLLRNCTGAFLKNYTLSVETDPFPEPVNTPIGQICFTGEKKKEEELFSLRTVSLPLLQSHNGTTFLTI